MHQLTRLLVAGVLAFLCGDANAQGYPPSSPALTQAIAPEVVVRQQVMKNSAVFFNNTYPDTYQSYPPNTWHRVDLKPWGVPANSPWAFLSGILIITHNGDTSMTANLMVGVRRVGDIETGNCDTTGRYNGQAAATAASGGTRSTYSTYVPLVDGAFEVCWSPNPNVGPYPSVPAVGVNLHVQAWGAMP